MSTNKEPYTYTSTYSSFLVIRCVGDKRIVYAVIPRTFPAAEDKAADVAAALNLLHAARTGKIRLTGT